MNIEHEVVTHLPPRASAFIALQIAAFAWFIIHAAATTVAGMLYKKVRFPAGAASQYVSQARQAAIQAVLVPLNMFITYLTSVLTFLLGSWQYVLIAGTLLAGGYVMVNHQVALIVAVDQWWAALAHVAIPPLRAVGNLLFVILEIVIGIVNFLSHYSSTVLRKTTSQIVHAPGYQLNSFFSLFSGVALSLSNVVVSTVTWTKALASVRHGVYFQTGQWSSTTEGFYSSSSSTAFYDLGDSDTIWENAGGKYVRITPPALDLKSVVAPLRMVAYDVVLRIRHACPAENGLLDIAVVNILDPNTTSVDQLVHYSVNLLLSVPEVFLLSVILYFKTGLYFSPDVDYVFDTANSAINNAMDIGNNLFTNAVNYIQSSVLDRIVWTPVPIFQIPAHYLMIQVDIARLVAKAAFNVPYFIDPALGKGAAIPSPYDLFDTTHVFDDIYEFNNQTFTVVLGGIYPQYTAGVGNVTREVFNVFAAYAEFGAQAARRLLIGTDPHNTTRFADAWDAYPECALASHPSGPGLANLWNGLYDVAQVFDTTVTQKIYNLAFSLQNATRAYYPPMATSVNLAFFSLANLQSTLFRQATYIVYAVITSQPPSFSCIMATGKVTRITVDNFLDSLPDLWEFFLNVGLANDLSNAHFNCASSNVANFMMTGSLKSYYFAGKVCNTHYADGSLVSCDFAMAADCPSYALPYADLNANLICATDVALMGALKTSVQTLRIALQYAEQQVVQLLACIIDSSTCNLAQALSMQSILAEVSVVNCFTYETTVKVSNVLSALLGFAYASVYKVANSGAGAVSYNSNTMSGPDLHAYVAGRHGLPNKYHTSPHELACNGYTPGGALQCLSSPYCEWNGVKCRQNTGAHLAFQQYPLEAATTTLMVSLLSPLLFWPQYMLFMQANRFAVAFEIDPADRNPASTMVGKVVALFRTDAYFWVLDSIRIATLAVRDGIYGIIELIRAFLYVVNKCTSGTCDGAKEFDQFQHILNRIVSLLEELVANVLGAVFQLVVQMGEIINDFAQIITNPQANAETLLKDIFNRLFGADDSIFASIVGLLPKVVLSIPGIKDACAAVNSIITEVVQPIVKFIREALGASLCVGALPCISLGSILHFDPNDIKNVTTLGSCNFGANQSKPEASPCSSDTMCAQPGAMCRVSRVEDCPSHGFLEDSFAYACGCRYVLSKNFYCNYGSGFCQEGLSPFDDPLEDIPPQSQWPNPANNKSLFIDSSQYFDAMCFVMPAYACKKHSDAELFACIEQYANRDPPNVEGPYLCRNYCSPDSLSDDNTLLCSENIGCFCALGMSIGAGKPPLDIAKDFLTDNLQLFFLPTVHPPGPPPPNKPPYYRPPAYPDLTAPPAPPGWQVIALDGQCKPYFDEPGYFTGVNGCIADKCFL